MTTGKDPEALTKAKVLEALADVSRNINSMLRSMIAYVEVAGPYSAKFRQKGSRISSTFEQQTIADFWKTYEKMAGTKALAEAQAKAQDPLVAAKKEWAAKIIELGVFGKMEEFLPDLTPENIQRYKEVRSYLTSIHKRDKIETPRSARFKYIESLQNLTVKHQG